MLVLNSDILELKFEGGGINPENVKPSEIANLLTSFERLILQQLKDEHPAINIDDVIFAFEKIDNQSLDLIFKIKQLRDLVIGTYISVAAALNTGDFSQLNRSSLPALKEIIKFSKKHNCEGHFNLNSQIIASFSPDFEIDIISKNSITGDTTVFGKVIRIGGEDPKIHFRVSETDKLIFDVSEEVAKKLSQKLYEFIGLVGIATWDANTFAIEKFEIKQILDLNNRPIPEVFEELRGLIGKHWDEIEDIENYIN